MFSLSRLLLVTVLGCMLFACAPTHENLFRHSTGEPVILEDATPILDAMEKRRVLVSDYRALTRATLTHDEKHESFRYAFVYSLSEKALRIEALPLQGAMSLSLFASYQGEFSFLVPSEKKYYHGPLTPQRLKQFFGILASERDLMHLLVAALPTDMFTSSLEHVNIYTEQQQYLVRDSVDRFAAIVNGTTGALSRLEVRDRFQNKVVLRVRYDSFQLFDGVLLPSAMTFELPHEGAILTLVVQQVKLPKVPLASALFSIPLPAGYENIELKDRL
ncbi:MAG: DUF4292 domain-containing protein [Bdellovibrionales bacterium]|nr:DUF4292 domain-containing protein [Bdellovibrionales bacterium]